MTVVRAVFPHQAADKNQLSLAEGDQVVVVQRNSGGWWIGRNEAGEIGLFPASYTTEAKEKPKFSVPKEFKTNMLQSTTPTTTPTTTPRAGSAGSLSCSQDPSSARDDAERRRKDDMKMKELLGLGAEDVDEEEALDFLSPNLSPSMMRVSELRKECRLLTGDLKKLLHHKDSLNAEKANAVVKSEKLNEQVRVATAEVHAKNTIVQRMERTIELLRFALDHGPTGVVPPNACPPDQLWPVDNGLALSVSAMEALEKATQKAHQPLPATAQPAPPSNRTEPPREIVEEIIEEVIDGEPFDESTTEDVLARKLIKKLKKRMGEAETTRDEYLRQERKIRKKIAKYEETAQSSGSPNTVGGVSTTEHAAKITQLREQVKSLQEKCQKYQNDSIDQELQGQEDELHAVLKKLNKRLHKGNAANEEMTASLEQTKQRIASSASSLKEAEKEKAAALKARAAAEADIEKAAAEEQDAVKQLQEEADYLDSRVAVEHERIADFRNQLEILKVQQSAALGSPALSPTTN